MSFKIYVGNLSFDSSEADLTGLFATYGEVTSAKVITDQFTGRSRGFGFIEMTNREEGLKAIQELDSKDLDGRSLKQARFRSRYGLTALGGTIRDPGLFLAALGVKQLVDSPDLTRPTVSLVDVEGLYAPGLPRPEVLPAPDS